MNSGIQLPVYMDYQATTPLDGRVLDMMMPYLTTRFGNPHSTTHKFGWETADAIDRARGQVASLIGAGPKEIVFTSGATESNNLAIKGLARFYRKHRSHMVTVATEHKCVLESAAAMEREGMAVTYLPVQPDGLVDLDALRAAIGEQTLLVSVMAVNNEIGVIQKLAGIGAICRERRVFFHTDAAQAVGKIALDVEAMNIDLMSISGHKVYGPKGIGALYVRAKSRLKFDPILSGGGQEGGLRSGTLSPALCVGLGAALRGRGRRDGRRARPPAPAVRPLRRRRAGRCAGCGAERRPGAADSRQHQPQLPRRRRRAAAGPAARAGGVVGRGLRLGGGGTILCAARAGRRGTARPGDDPLRHRPASPPTPRSTMPPRPWSAKSPS